jgi:outer membrane translocation and assembly module TamA
MMIAALPRRDTLPTSPRAAAGYAWNEPDTWDFKRLKAGLGFGVRLKLPIVGLLRMDFAYPVPEYDFHFHLSLGHTF